MSDKKLRVVLTCSKCYRVSKNFIPLPAKDSIAVIWCIFCKIVLVRFDYGDKEYEERHPDEVRK
jgi:hypothetical protein